MTRKQELLHWKIWSRVCAANGWRMARGRMAEGAAESRNKSRFHERTWALAERCAVAEHRAVTVNDLRHGCYLAAAGKESHLQLGNREFNRVLSWWKVLTDPDSLSAMMEWDSPEIAERRGLVERIRRDSSPGYAEEISERKHKTPFYEDLPIEDLRKLMVTVKEAKKRNEWKAELRGESSFVDVSGRARTAERQELVEEPF